MWRYFVLSGLILGFATAFGQIHIEDSSYVAIRQNGFFFTSPLLDCQYQYTYIPPFESELRSFIDDAKGQNLVEQVSVYFKQLENGYGFGIDEHRKYHPASLMKVANMMYLMKISETDTGLLRRTYPFHHNDDIIDTESILEEGRDYSVWRYLSEMIVRSDNQAMSMLHEILGDRQLWRHVFNDLGINLNTTASATRLLSPKLYSMLFQVLYNGSYLSKKNSELCLKLLAKTKFAGGILAGIPDERVAVANKFGFYKATDLKELHETAIVYLGDSPYLLCIMTQGLNASNLRTVVSGISGIVYFNCKIAAEKNGVKTALISNSKFISPLIDCKSTPIVKSFYANIKELVKTFEDSPSIEHVSVYMRQLESGHSFSINGEVSYPASNLMEIPQLMALLKMVEKFPGLLNSEVTFTEELAQRQIDPNTCLIVGKQYSILALLSILVRTSDNNARELLFQSPLNQQGSWFNLLSSLGLDVKFFAEDGVPQPLYQPEDISLFFRVLYNSTYLSRDNSELALNMLSSIKLKQGICASVSPDTYTAVKRADHKSVANGATTIHLHEGGIVYMEGNPYLLVIMTEGSSKTEQLKCVSTIAQEVANKMKHEY